MRTILVAATLLLAGCIAAPSEGDGSTAGAGDGQTKAEETLHFAPPTKVPLDGYGYEPGIRVAPNGMLVIHAHKGNAAIEGGQLASWLFYSMDNGTTWTPAPSDLDQRDRQHHLEGDVAFDDAGAMFFFDHRSGGGSMTRWALTDSGPVFQEMTPMTIAGKVSYDDRPWLEAYGDGQLLLLSKTPLVPAVFLDGTTQEDSDVRLYRSTDSGATWTFIHAFASTNFCDLALQGSEPSHVAVGCYHDESLTGGNRRWTALHTSTDGGGSFATTTVMDIDEAGKQFPSIAIGEDGATAFAFIDGEVGSGTTTTDTPDDPTSLWVATWADNVLETRVIADGATHERPGISITDGRLVVTASSKGVDERASWHPWAWVGTIDTLGNSTPTLLDPTPQTTAVSSPGDFWEHAIDPWGGIHACWSRDLERPTSISANYEHDIYCTHSEVDLTPTDS